jgi:hypothetical protein
MDQLAAEVDSLIGDPADTGLIIDESSFLKKGKASGYSCQKAGWRIWERNSWLM